MFNTGFGSSNNGNTARKFFEKSQISSAITGVDENVIHRFAIILTAINTSEAVDAKKFDEYARETAQLLVSKYGWWYMSPTVHKVLLHGGEMISYSILPLGVCELTFFFICYKSISWISLQVCCPKKHKSTATKTLKFIGASMRADVRE